jgi:hypothetical protein
MFFMEVETLGDAFTHSWRITTRCAGGVEDNRTHTRPCIYREELDLHTLVDARAQFPPGAAGEPSHVPTMRESARHLQNRNARNSQKVDESMTADSEPDAFTDFYGDSICNEHF